MRTHINFQIDTYAYDLAANRIATTDSGPGSGASNLASTYDPDGRLAEGEGKRGHSSLMVFYATWVYWDNGIFPCLSSPI